MTCLSVLTSSPSSVVSLKPPLYALVRGVRMARVITTSSAFFVVLSLLLAALLFEPARAAVSWAVTYMADNPLVEGVIWFTMDLRRSVILIELWI